MLCMGPLILTRKKNKTKKLYDDDDDDVKWRGIMGAVVTLLNNTADEILSDMSQAQMFWDEIIY